MNDLLPRQDFNSLNLAQRRALIQAHEGHEFDWYVDSFSTWQSLVTMGFMSYRPTRNGPEFIVILMPVIFIN